MVTVLHGHDHGQYHFYFWKKKEGEYYVSICNRYYVNVALSESKSHCFHIGYLGRRLFHKKNGWGGLQLMQHEINSNSVSVRFLLYCIFFPSPELSWYFNSSLLHNLHKILIRNLVHT